MSQDRTEAYLSLLPADQRAALEKVRRQILAAAPGAEPHFGYGLPGFKLRGHPLIYFGAAKAHCAIYGNNSPAIAAKLASFEHSKGAIRFTPEAPLPAALIKEIVQSRSAENEAKWGGTERPASSPAKPRKKDTAVAAPAKPKRGKSDANDGSAAVDVFLEALAHPQRELVAAVRAEIARIAPKLGERVKWNAPSTHLEGTDFSAFNLRAKGFVQLILLFPNGVVGEETGILEGEWKDRRFVRFVDEADYRDKRTKLGKIIRAWIEAQSALP